LKELVDEPKRMAMAIEEIPRVTPISKSGRPRITGLVLEDTIIPRGEVLFLLAVVANPIAHMELSVL
jgi:cytochrome P450